MAAAANTSNRFWEFDENPVNILAFRANPCCRNPEFNDPNTDFIKFVQQGNWVLLDLDKSRNGEVKFEEQGIDVIVVCMIVRDENWKEKKN